MNYHDDNEAMFREISRLEGLMEGIKVAMSEIKKHIGADTNVPTSAKRSEGRDINVPTTKLPAWVKIGAWVFFDGYMLGRITSLEKYSNPTYVVDLEYMSSEGTNADLTRCVKDLKPVRFRPYKYEEAKGLLGKTMELPEIEGLICAVSYDRESGDVRVNGECFKSLSEDGCLIDGVPFGVPEVDEEALEGGEE